MTTCTIPGCKSDAWARGMCQKHLNKFYRYGDPLAGRARTDKGHGTGSLSWGYMIRTDADGIRKREHIRVAEAALGKPLPPGAVVHHVDQRRSNNEPTNLVICPDAAYHNLLHQRMRARDACGNPNWRKCCRCGVYDAPENVSTSGSQAYHPECNRRHVKDQTAKRRIS